MKAQRKSYQRNTVAENRLMIFKANELLSKIAKTRLSTSYFTFIIIFLKNMKNAAIYYWKTLPISG
jgi:hypothetical protein